MSKFCLTSMDYQAAPHIVGTEMKGSKINIIMNTCHLNYLSKLVINKCDDNTLYESISLFRIGTIHERPNRNRQYI